MTQTPFYERVDSEELKRLNHEEEKLLMEIADHYDVSDKTARRAFDENDVEFRDHRVNDPPEAGNCWTGAPFYEQVDPDELERLHHEEEMLLIDLVDHYGVSNSAIRRAMRYHDIEFIEHQHAHARSFRKTMSKLVLRALFVKEGLTMEKIGERYNVSERIVQQVFEEYEINVKKWKAERRIAHSQQSAD